MVRPVSSLVSLAVSDISPRVKVCHQGLISGFPAGQRHRGVEDVRQGSWECVFGVGCKVETLTSRGLSCNRTLCISKETDRLQVSQRPVK